MLGSALSSGFLQSKYPKIILATCLVLNMVSLVLFTLTDNFILLATYRFFTGLFQVPFAIFMPVWADAFGNEI